MLHHSDRGSQYASKGFRAKQAALGIEVSMSRRGNCRDNAVVESLFETIEQKLVYHARWNDKAEARSAIHEYIEDFNNRQRLISTLGNRTPGELDQGVV